MSHTPKSKLSLHIIINTIGTYMNIGFSLVFVLVLTRMLSRVEYGTLTVLLGVIYIGATVLDCGVTTVIYSAIPSLYQSGESKKLDTLIKTILYYQSVCATVAITLLILFFPSLIKEYSILVHLMPHSSSLPYLYWDLYGKTPSKTCSWRWESFLRSISGLTSPT